jgi:hypothetical protein
VEKVSFRTDEFDATFQFEGPTLIANLNVDVELAEACHAEAAAALRAAERRYACPIG